MRTSIIPIATMALVLAATCAAAAQADDTAAARGSHRHAAHHSSHHRTAPSEPADSMYGSENDYAVTGPLVPKGEAGGPLPNFFPNCEHPAPWFCTKNY